MEDSIVAKVKQQGPFDRDEAYKDQRHDNSRAHVMEEAIKRSTAEKETLESKEQPTIPHKRGRRMFGLAEVVKNDSLRRRYFLPYYPY